MKQKHKIKTPSSERNSPSSIKKNNSPETKKRIRTLALIIAVFGALIYSNTLSNGYVLDDFSAIKENNIVRQGLDGIPEIFKTSYRQGYLSIQDGLYRPLSLALYAVEWHFFPDSPGVSHFVNIVLYGLTGFLLFLFLLRIASALPDPARGQTSRFAETFAFIATLLFLAHPLHVEVVANIKSRDEMLCFFFTLAGFIYAFKYLESRKNKFLFLGMGSYFLSLLSKETSITFLALLPLALHFFSSASLGKNMAVTAFFVLTAGIYLALRSSVLQGALADDSVSLADNVIAGTKTLSTHMGTAFYILGLYLKLLVFPHPLSYDYSYDHISIVEMTNIFSILSLLFYLFIGGFAALILWKSIKQKNSAKHQSHTTSPAPAVQRAVQPVVKPAAQLAAQPAVKPAVQPAVQPLTTHLLSFGILFFLITIFLFSNLVLVIGTSMGDRLMYFPSLGFCICLAVVAIKLLGIDSLRLSLRLAPLIIIVLLFSIKTWSRNPDWKDNHTLYAHDVHIVPNSVKAHYYLGLELVKVVADAEKDLEKKKKIYEEGISELEKAVKILPAFASAYTQMGVAWYRMRNFEKAIENYNKAAELRPSDAITLNNIGTVYFEWKKYPEAKEKFQQAVLVDVRFVDAHMNLGSVLGTMGDFPAAISSFQNAITYAPDNARAYYFMAMTYQNMKDGANADKYFRVAEQMDPKLKRP